MHWRRWSSSARAAIAEEDETFVIEQIRRVPGFTPGIGE